MKPSTAIKEYIKLKEGFHSELYLDVAQKATIGYGHLVKGITSIYLSEILGENSVNINEIELTEGEANRLFERDLREHTIAVNRIINSTYAQVNQSMFDALVSFSFNVGYNNLRTSTLMQMLHKGDKQEAAKQFLRWKYAGKRVVQGLLNRRIEEMNIFLTDNNNKDLNILVSDTRDVIIPEDLTRKKDRSAIQYHAIKYRNDLFRGRYE